jgi:hypothetical protein
MRARLAARSKKEIARGYLNYYAEQDSTVSQVGQLETADDERRNVIVVRERYHFGAFWRDSKREFPVSALAGHLGDPSIKLRRMAYRLDFPLDVTHTTIVRLPSHPDIEATTTDLADEHLRFAFNVRTDGNDLVIRYDLRALADAVPPEKAQRFFSTLDEIKQRAWFVLHRDNLQRPGFWGWTERIGGVAGYVILGLVVLAIAVAFVRELFRGKRRRSFKKNGRFAQGEAAATAIEVDSEEEATAQVPRLKCECGARYRAPDPTQSQRVAYDGRSLLLLEARCSACERHRRVFFSVRPDPVASAS